MFDAIKNLFGRGANSDYKQLLKEGAVVVDVRSPSEFAGGHIAGAINIPVDQLVQNLGKIKDRNKPIITCCASGMRSASAKAILSANGYKAVYNGGGWSGLKSRLQ